MESPKIPYNFEQMLPQQTNGSPFEWERINAQVREAIMAAAVPHASTARVIMAAPCFHACITGIRPTTTTNGAGQLRCKKPTLCCVISTYLAMLQMASRRNCHRGLQDCSGSKIVSVLAHSSWLTGGQTRLVARLTQTSLSSTNPLVTSCFTVHGSGTL